jgi:hypothetical protein
MTTHPQLSRWFDDSTMDFVADEFGRPGRSGPVRLGHMTLLQDTPDERGNPMGARDHEPIVEAK